MAGKMPGSNEGMSADEITGSLNNHVMEKAQRNMTSNHESNQSQRRDQDEQREEHILGMDDE